MSAEHSDRHNHHRQPRRALMRTTGARTAHDTTGSTPTSARPARRPAMSSPEALRDEGMTRAEVHADPRVILAIDALIAEANDTGRPWSANDIRKRVPVTSRGLVGNRVRSALMRRQMVQVGEVRSTSGPTHAKKIGVYVGAEHVQAVAS